MDNVLQIVTLRAGKGKCIVCHVDSNKTNIWANKSKPPYQLNRMTFMKRPFVFSRERKTVALDLFFPLRESGAMYKSKNAYQLKLSNRRSKQCWSLFHKKIRSGFFVFVILATCILASCSTSSKSNNSRISITPETNKAPQVNLALTLTLTPTQILPSTSTSTPTLLLTPTTTTNPAVEIVYPINDTQMPIVVETKSADNSQYLYKDAIVTVKLADPMEAFAYLNLDDLKDNGINNSDIAIERAIGTDTSYSLFPINNSYFFRVKNGNLNFDSCLQHFPVKPDSSVEYYNQGNYFNEDAGYFCFLTNENRIAIVNYIQGSKKRIEDPNSGLFDVVEELSFKITVFEEIVDNQ